MIMPTRRAQAMFEISTEPNFKNIPPMPVINIAATTNRFLESFRLISLNMRSPETDMKPYRAIDTPPITQLGMLEMNTMIG